MIFVLISVLLFGLVHPLSKWFLDGGIPLSYFCLLYVGFRLIVQSPALFNTQPAPAMNTKRRTIWLYLLGFGLIGAFLQLFEFKGLEQGLSPGTVTFLMYSYPIWLSLFHFFKKSDTGGRQRKVELFQSFSVIVGVGLVAGASLSELKLSIVVLMYPLLASLFIALWIIASGALRKKGLGTFKLSFYYDLFSFIVLLGLFATQLENDRAHFQQWANVERLSWLSAYSIFVGLVPNLLFYFGSKKVSSHFAGISMTFEPVLSVFYASFIWHSSFSSAFWAGAFFIIVANLPLQKVKNLFWGRNNMKTRMKKTLTKPLRSLAKGMFVVALLGLVMKDAAARNMYNCRQEAREMKGLHNMVLFGQPEGDLYAYHLPLFSGEVNGEGGHVQMHVYQGIWRVTLDQETLKSYRSKFAKEKSPSLPFPFFSFSPREKKFKVPELICEREFEMKAVAAYGHVESNPEFPKPEVLKQGLSTIKKSRTVFAQRFHGASIDELTYILFGTKNQYYMAHYLTDDENSFDQIVAVNVKDSILESRVRREGGVLVKVPLAKNPHLIRVFNDPRIKQNNNLYRLPVPVKTPGEVPGESVSIEVGGRDSVIEVEARIYFNANSDLHRF